MPRVRQDADKWVRNAGQAAGDYAAGAAAPRVSQSQAAAAAADTYITAVTASGADGYKRGVEKAGDGKWRDGVEKKGRARYGQGVALAKDRYNSGFAPYKSAIEGVTLQPRGPKGSNYGRVQQIGDALRSVKTGG